MLNKLNFDGCLSLKRAFVQRVLVLLLLSSTTISFSQTTENFDSGIPSTWAIKSNLATPPINNNWISTAAGAGYGGGTSKAASVNPASNVTTGTTAQYYMISPQLVIPTDGEIRFYTKQGSFTNRGATYQLKISTANQPDLSSFNVTLESWTEANLYTNSATTYEEKIVTIPSTIQPGLPVYIAFVAITNQTGIATTSGDTWFVDNFRMIGSCSPVTAVNTTIGAYDNQISWTHPTATQFGIEVVPSGAGHGTTGTPVTGTSYTATGLTPSTTYDVYIITNCDASTSSSWAGPFTFTTSAVGLTCPTAIQVPADVTVTPYVYTNNLSQFYDADTYVNYNSQILACQPANTPSTWNLLLGNHAYFSFTPSTTGLVNITQAVNVASGGGGNNCYNASSSLFVFNACAGVGTSAGCLGGLKTDTNVPTAQLSNFYVQAGQTYIILISSPYPHTNPGAGICFTLTISGSTCPAPALITYSNLQQTSISASWNNAQNLVSAWEYIALPVTSGTPSTSQPGTATTTNINNPVTGLLPGTAYNLFVRSVCGGTPGPWSAPMLFTTQCNPLPLPYYTGFTTATATNPEPCWTVLNLNNDQYKFKFANSANSEPVAQLRTGDAVPNDMLITPQFHFDGVTQKRLRFKYNIYGNWGLIVNNPPGGPGSFEVSLSNSGVGEADFTTILVPLNSYVTQYNFIEMIVPIPANIVGNINIAWILPPGSVQTGIQFYIDDVYIEDMPACSDPIYPAVTPGSITPTSATISWTNGYNNTQWELVAQPLGTGTPTTTLAPGAIVFNNVTTTPFTLTGLNPSTQYEFYMRTICSATIQSNWVGPINFNTLCIAQPTPYYESLNTDDPNTKKFCWSVINNSDVNTKWRIEATEAQIRALSTMAQPFVSFDDWLVSAPINAVGLKRLRFSHRAVNGIFNPTPRGNVEVLMSTTQDFSTYTVLVPSFDFTNLAYEEKSVLFAGTGTIYIAFRVPPTMTNPGSSGIMMIDDVFIDDAPACPDPGNLSVTNSTSSSANLSWTIGYTETQWQVAVQPAGNGIPTGSGAAVNTTPAYSATGLTPDTLYEYYVRAVCSGNGNSTWVGPLTFRTKCNPLPTPFVETFDSNSSTETCWTIVNGNGDTNDWNLNQPANPIFGDQMAALFTGSNGNNNDWLITPTLTAHSGQRLRFYYKTYSSDFEEDIRILLSTNGAATNQFTTLLYQNTLLTTTDATGTVLGSNTITVTSVQDIRVGDKLHIMNNPIPYNVTVTNITGNVLTMAAAATATVAGPLNIDVVHEIINNTTPKEMVINLDDFYTFTGNTNINIAFNTPFFPPNPWGYRSQYTFIDNVIVEDIPVCPNVTNVTVVAANLLDTSAQINWDPVGSETSWEMSLQPYGTAAPVGATLSSYLITTSSHPYTFTGLTPGLKYQFYVRAICSSLSQSVWVGPFEFTTKCDLTNVCQYTISVTNGSTARVTRTVDVVQNGQVVQSLNFPGFGQPATIDYTVFLCKGVQFNLYWDAIGNGLGSSQAQMIVRDESNTIVWTSPLGLGTPYTNIYTGFASCGTTTCPQPSNLTSNNQGVLSWTPGGSETQWEVFIQPLGNGTLPQSGNVVNTPSYTPSISDFADFTAGTYEYFVRALCGPSNTSLWFGPQTFIRNDEPSNSIHLGVNTGSTCSVSAINASFIGATASTQLTTCSGLNGGDIWYDFVATSKVHTIELSDFAPGSYYASSSQGPWPKIMMSLYELQIDGSLIEKGCSDNNSFVASYSTELVVGNTYKIRLKLDSATPNNKKFHICITTPTDLCNVNAFNYDFEKLPMQGVTGVPTMINATVVPGWRVNTVVGQLYFQEQNNSLNVTPYSGGQCVQLIHDNESLWNPSDPNIKGLYKDFDTSEIPIVDYSFASATRTSSSTVQLYAGQPSGPFTLVAEHTATSLVWQLIQGNYLVPPGQTTTRFIFRVKNNVSQHILDAANFKAPVNIVTEDFTLDCTNTTATLVARGLGQWEADANNPSTSIIATPNNTTTTISGISSPGNYIFHWKTRYCDKTITITKPGNTEIAQVLSPVEYCLNNTAAALSATVSSGNTTMWYTQAIGGTGSALAPTPSTIIAGNSQVYYVSAADGSGCEGPRSQIVVQVNDLPTITGTLSACVGNSTQLTGSGTAATTNAWASSDTSVATISATGLVTGVSAGTSTITYTNDKGCQETATVTINELPTITGTLSACIGNTTQLTGSITAATTNAWSSSNTAVATISAAGLVTGVSAGTSTITYTNSNGCQVDTIVTIETLPTITGTLSVCVGLTTQLTGSGTAATTNTWTSSDTAVATVSNTGLVTGISVGTTTITYTNNTGCIITTTVSISSQIVPTFNSILACQNATVVFPSQSLENITGTWSPNTIDNSTIGTTTYTFIPNTTIPSQACAINGSLSITINALPTITGTLSACIGNTTQLTGSGTAATTNAWSSSNIAVATISATGLVTGVSDGTSIITYVNSNGCQVTAIVTINGLPTITGTLSACVGNTTQLTGSGTDATTNAWISSNTSVATISTTGLVIGVGEGTSTITYTNSNGCQVTAIVTINGLPTITGSLSACVGNITQLTGSATAATTNAWNSSNISVATVSNTGLVTGVSAGTSTITYTNSNGCQVTATITINGLPTITGTLSACVGTTTQFTGSATAATTNAWTSSNTSVATISANGLVTGVTEGTSTITYTNSNGCQVTATITINGLPTISGTLIACVGNTTQLTGSATAATTNAWTSSNTSVATVSTTGLVTGVSEGTSTITYVNSDGCQVTATIIINGLPTIIGTLSACVGNTTQLTGSGTAATTDSWISSNTAVATINNTGLVTGVSEGTSTVTYTNSNGCQVTAIVTINGLPTITGTLSACVGNTTQLTGSATATTTNAWSSSNTAVATISTTGLVSTVSAGTTIITYTNSNGCQTTATVTVNALATPNVTFSYAQACINASVNPLPVLPTNFTSGGVFSSTTLTVNATIGAVNLASATVGSHQVIYTLSQNLGTCTAAGTYTATIVISAGITPITSFTYQSTYCANSVNELPTTTSGFYVGGVFSSTAGLVINASTGEINFIQSTSGSYTITYAVQPNASNCNTGGTSTFPIVIAPELDYTIEDICQAQMLELHVTPSSGSFTGVNYVWRDQLNAIVDTDSIFNVDQYMTQNPSLSLPQTFTVSVELNGCSYTSSFTVQNNPCRLIPRGISPNNDQVNDTFDLTGLGVTELNIFNRYGAKVYTFSGNYTNQWYGLTDGGNELPDGTYFYSILKGDGSSVTGWVYINRQY